MKEIQFIEEIEKNEHIIIYGAGMVGELVYKRLTAYHVEKQVIGFAVSRLQDVKEYLGISVYPINSLIEYKESAIIIVATLPILHDEIMRTIGEYKFRKVICIETELYEDMANNYMEEFHTTKCFAKDKIDVVFMASDNNSSAGAFLSMVNLNCELNKKGISTLVVLPIYGNGERKLIEKGVEYTFIHSEDWGVLRENPELDNKRSLLLQNNNAIKKMEKLLEKYDVKIVHNNTTYTYIGAVAAYNKGIPVVWHLRENIYDQGYDFYDEKRAVNLINQSNKIILISQYMTSCYDGLNQEKTQVVYNGIDVGKFYVKRKILNNQKRINIVMVGRLAPHKGQAELIEAARILKENGTVKFHIQLIGKGEEIHKRKLINLVKEYQLMEYIEFLGEQNDVVKYYEQADIAVCCSKAEPFGRVTVEGQVSGCLVIGSNTGATPELVKDGETGLLYQRGDSEDLAKKITWAVEKFEEAREIAAAGQKQAYINYTKEHNAEEIVRIYSEILNSI